jgi:methionyl-tRNA synthetase
MPEPRYVVLADPPTPNGDLHVGHLSGPYFAADAFTRYLRLRGRQVAFLSNFDSNQPYVLTAGKRLGLTPEAVVEHFTGRIARSWAACAIEPDLVGSPDARQGEFVARFFADLYERGKLLVKDEPMPYCTSCERYLFEAFLQGSCPHCGTTPCYGNGCESCALPNRPEDMGDKVCRLCGEPPREVRSYRGLFLPLSRYQDELAAHLRSGTSRYRKPVLDLVLPALDKPLPDIPLSYVSDYGLPVALPGFAGQIWNVRLEILPALIDTVDKWRETRPGDGWDWRGADDYEVVCFHGWENTFQYVVSFNTLLLASGVGFKIPAANLTNEFYLLEGKKFSTTRNHAVWGTDILARVSSDQLRFYLALTNPEVTQTDFVIEAFRETTDRCLTRPWNELQSRLAAALAASPRSGPEPLPEALAGRLAGYAAQLEGAYELPDFSLRRAAAIFAEALGAIGAQAAAALARPDGLSAALTAARALALFGGPLLPRLSARLLAAIGGVGGDGGEGGWDTYREPVDPRDVRWSGDLTLAPLAQADLRF